MKIVFLSVLFLGIGFVLGVRYGFLLQPKPNECDAAMEGCAYTASQMMYAARKAERALERCEEALNEAQ